MKLIDLIKEYSNEQIVEKLLTTKDLTERDELKGQLLAYADFETILKVYEEKDLAKLKGYLEIFDCHADNLNLFINVTEPRQEVVLLSKMDTLKKIKAKLIEYATKTIESGAVQGLHSAETQEDEGDEGAPAKDKVSKK